MATPSFVALRESFPDLELDVAVGPWARPALARNPQIARLLSTETLLGGRRPDPRTLLRVAARLRAGRYDAALVYERSLWLALLPLLAGIPVRVGFDSGRRGVTHSIGIAIAGVRHEAESYLACAAAVGATATVPRMEFEPGEAGEAEAHAELGAVDWRGEPYALLHPGGGANPGMRLEGKRWPPERFAAVADRLADAGVRPLLVCGQDEMELASAVAAAARSRPALVGYALSLAGLGAVARGAAVYVGNDTGPTHLAVAVDTPTVAVFGPSDERRYGPFGRWPDSSTVGEAVANPLLAPDDPAPPWLARPVDAVSVDAVWAAVERVLARAQRWRPERRAKRSAGA